MTRLACALCAFYLTVFIWLAWWTATVYGHAPAWFIVGNVAACFVLVIAFTQQLALIDTHRENTALKQAEDEQVAAAEHQAPTEADAACCETWWASLGIDHDDTCPHHTPRSSAA